MVQSAINLKSLDNILVKIWTTESVWLCWEEQLLRWSLDTHKDIGRECIVVMVDYVERRVFPVLFTTLLLSCHIILTSIFPVTSTWHEGLLTCLGQVKLWFGEVQIWFTCPWANRKWRITSIFHILSKYIFTFVCTNIFFRASLAKP